MHAPSPPRQIGQSLSLRDAPALEVIEGRRKPAEEEVAVFISKDNQDTEDYFLNESDLSSEGSPWEISDSESLVEIAPQGDQKTAQVSDHTG